MKKVWIEFWIGFCVLFLPTISLGILFQQGYLSTENIINIFGVFVSVITILFVVRNTNRQIENQNIQLRKPYIVNRIIRKEQASDLVQVYRFTDLNILPQENVLENSYCVRLTNFGYGIATNIFVMSMCDEVKEGGYITGKYKYVKNKSFEVVAEKQDKTILIEFYSPKLGAFDTKEYYFICFYSDINQNIYSIIIKVIKGSASPFSTKFYHCNSAEYKDILKDINVNYKEKEKRYKDLIFGREE